MYTLTVENPNGEKLTLTQNESRYQIAQVTGLNPPKANIYTTDIAGMDGARFKSSHLEMRNVVLTIAINGSVEQNRLRLYNFFGTGRWCKLYYTNDSRQVYCEGYCENVDGSLFAIKQTMQVSVVCPNPYFKSLEAIVSDISKVFANFEFPFAINEAGKEFSIISPNREAVVYNEGEIPCGVIISMRAETDGIINPTIRNVATGEYLGVSATLNAGDVLEVNTNKGKKAVLRYVDGVAQNAINSLVTGSSWLQLQQGVNSFMYETESDNAEELHVEFEYNILYEGV